ncbi:MAG: MFS transporter [Rhodospirillaceae bacterium]|nr:MFS transporter [Rhodospirillaceae bacterium]
MSARDSTNKIRINSILGQNQHLGSPKKSWWLRAVGLYTDRRSFALLLLGISAGMPYFLLHGSLTAWLREGGVDRAMIGYISWVGVFYGVKVLWAPLVDQIKIPLLTRFLGKRRGWILLSQIGIVSGLLLMVWGAPVFPDPILDQPKGLGNLTYLGNMGMFILAILWVAFWSATQDIAIDAYRIEVAGEEFQGAMVSNYILGYRIAGSLVVGVGAFYLADLLSWPDAYLLMAACFLPLILVVLLSHEPQAYSTSPARGFLAHIQQAVLRPFIEFFQRQSWSSALVILGFIALCKVSDIVMGPMVNPLYKDLGFTNIEIANITKVYGFAITILGGFIAGILVARYSAKRLLLPAIILLAVPNLMFMVLADHPKDILLLASAISADNFGNGLAATILVAYFSGLANKAYTATQYALFSSLMNLPGTILGGFSGWITEQVGYSNFFLISACLALPALSLAFILQWRPGVKSQGKT